MLAAAHSHHELLRVIPQTVYLSILSSEPNRSAMALEARAKREPIGIHSMVHSILTWLRYSYLKADNI